MAAAFQANAFQLNAFQSVSAPPVVITSPALGPGWNIDFTADATAARERERRKTLDRTELRHMIERAVLGIEEAPPSPIVTQAEQVLAPYRRTDDSVNTAAIALQIDVANQLLDIHARILDLARVAETRRVAELQRIADEQDDEEEAVLLLLAA